MNRIESPTLIGVILIVLAFALQGSCASSNRGSNSNQNYPSVASVSPQPGRPVQPQPEPSMQELFYGEGDCAPRFPNGMRGTCINNKPCSGFGVKDASGNMECDCFGVKGGCTEGKVCSVRQRACVDPKDDEK